MPVILTLLILSPGTGVLSGLLKKLRLIGRPMIKILLLLYYRPMLNLNRLVLFRLLLEHRPVLYIRH